MGKNLFEFLKSELLGSSLQIKSETANDVRVGVGEILDVKVSVDHRGKKVRFELYSVAWKRRVTVEELGGIDFLELNAQQELEKQNHEEVAEDVLLSLDLLRVWADANGYKVEEVTTEEKEPD